ncbi:MAG: histidine kinase [Omnitrophica bacterium RIFCSPLOWO2_12_FULL_44_17]|uniref:Histidine kinase n=1 Tax=Candidatus Danuiimicrobium aquiferis TaxID=1801832 RepID=A0A1G1L3A4_9BACT|nr:MAG: histidine kinase [Omnitrophica bacterium RIFCSPHIGHO2_02_FULL_45_28]OGW99612.1 MAG: histidine kinase [Omnitrophica bacterium RIFCSPLOWO2_12_FULL_44_17]OGX02367.1 MAG: histidine kinase [Omnitrophica bacterium RIFCSPLOWO2_02_FULL_44_11]
MEKKKILVIDDEAGLTRMLKRVLEDTGKFEVKTENLGYDGLATARTFMPDLIILDVIMPDVEGGFLAAQIKEDAQLKSIPIVFFTATATKEDTAAYRGVIGGYPFLAKPVTVNELLACIKKVLGK